MSYYIKKLTVRNFLGYRNFSIILNSDTNFFIGKNGTGKTNFIKLLHAAIALDTGELDEIPFDEFKIQFTDTTNGKSPELSIKRLPRIRSDYEFKFRRSGSEKYKTYTSTYTSSNRLRMDFYVHSGLTERSNRRLIGRDSLLSDLKDCFNNNIEFSWLPLVRYRGAAHHYYDPEDMEPMVVDPIDYKITDLVGQMTRYFSLLDNRAGAESKHFQRDYFLSLLAHEPESLDILQSKIINTDFRLEENTIRSIFEELEYDTKDYSDTVTKHFDILSKAIKSIDNPDSILVNDLFAIADSMRLHKIVENWNEYEQKKNKIFAPKNEFAELIDRLLINKSFNFDESNQPVIMRNNSSIPIKIGSLSSGEKQLFIIMAETMLQESKSFIFLADEPELSLHIDWQESLVRNIKKLNGKCQIIFATHSPDVVSIYQDNVIDFEAL